MSRQISTSVLGSALLVAGLSFAGLAQAQTAAPTVPAAPAAPAITNPLKPAAPAAVAPKPVAAKPTLAAPASAAVFPTAIAPAYASEKPGKQRFKTCLDQYNANKATNANGGLKWVAKGGYYSQCNTRLKG